MVFGSEVAVCTEVIGVVKMSGTPDRINRQTYPKIIFLRNSTFPRKFTKG